MAKKNLHLLGQFQFKSIKCATCPNCLVLLVHRSKAKVTQNSTCLTHTSIHIVALLSIATCSCNLTGFDDSETENFLSHYSKCKNCAPHGEFVNSLRGINIFHISQYIFDGRNMFSSLEKFCNRKMEFLSHLVKGQTPLAYFRVPRVINFQNKS